MSWSDHQPNSKKDISPSDAVLKKIVESLIIIKENMWSRDSIIYEEEEGKKDKFKDWSD